MGFKTAPTEEPGEPGDEDDGRLQPHGAVPNEWVSEFDGTTQAADVDEYERRLRADHELIQDLQWDGYAGRRWEIFAEALVAYGYQVMLAWIRRGEVFGKCAAHGLKGLTPRLESGISLQDARHLAQDSVAEAIVRFRDRVLKPRRWSPQGGASLKTFFVGQALIQFVPIYKTWVRTMIRESPSGLVPEEADQLTQRSTEEIAVARVEADRVLRFTPDLVAAGILVLTALGYAQQEIAELQELDSAKAVEARLYRLRKLFRDIA